MNKFHDIFLALEAKILNKDYAPGTLLPSEKQLMAIYQVSRETIRKALNLLINEGYIQKQQGKGSIVLDMERFDFPISGLTSYKELKDSQKIKSDTLVAELSLSQTPESISLLTNWKINSPMWSLYRQRKIDGEVVILDIDYLSAEIIPDLPEEKAANSIYEYFENDLGLTIGYAQKEIIAEKITDIDKKYMDLLPTDTHVIVVRSVVSLEDTRIFEITESRHRLDKFKFVDFARRRKLTEQKRTID